MLLALIRHQDQANVLDVRVMTSFFLRKIWTKMRQNGILGQVFAARWLFSGLNSHKYYLLLFLRSLPFQIYLIHTGTSHMLGPSYRK